jgi:hypothetical protein
LGHHKHTILQTDSTSGQSRLRVRVCLRKGCGRKYQPRRWNQRYCQDPECRKEVARWQSAKRQEKRRSQPGVRQQRAAAERQRRAACREARREARCRLMSSRPACQAPAEAQPTPGAWSRRRKNSAPFCDRPGCYEPQRTGCCGQTGYCGDDCRQAMNRVRDRERKCLQRKTPAGRFKRCLEYRARRAGRQKAVALPAHPASPGPAAVSKPGGPAVLGSQTFDERQLPWSDPKEVTEHDRETNLGSRSRAPPAR